MIKLALLVPIVALAGCDKEAPGKALVSVATTDPAFVGATVVMGTQRATIGAADGTGKAEATFVVTSGLPEGVPTLALEVPTACGPKQLAATATVENRFPNQLKLRFSVDDAAPSRKLKVWIDAPTDTTFQIGGTQVSGPTALVHGADCAPSLDVSLAGTPIGKVDTSSAEAVFLTATSDACYRVRYLAYGDTLHGTTEDVLRGQQVYRLTSDIDYFLEAAPELVKSATPGERHTEVTKIACP